MDNVHIVPVYNNLLHSKGNFIKRWYRRILLDLIIILQVSVSVIQPHVVGMPVYLSFNTLYTIWGRLQKPENDTGYNMPIHGVITVFCFM